MRVASLETQLLFMQSCHSVAWRLLEDHFYLSSSVLRCHILWVLPLCLLTGLINKSTIDLVVVYGNGTLQLLDQITFVDTPGVLSSEKQRTRWSYDFTGVISWFAAKCDLILLLFDPHKLNISDKFKCVIASFHGNNDKIQVVLNKAYQVDTQRVRCLA